MTDTADREARREERIPVDLNQPIALEVHNPNGGVTVRSADRTDVLVSHVSPDFSGVLGDDETALTIDARNNRIEVRAHRHGGIGWAGIAGDVDLDAVFGQITRAFRRGGSWATAKPGKARVAVGGGAWSDITIEVPLAMTGRVGVHSASGDIRIERVTSEIALNTMSGDVRLMRTSGDLVLQTTSGDLAIEGATGRLTAQTASGDVHVTSVQSEAFDVQTAAGDILLDAMLAGDGPFRVRTASGDVHLTLRRSTEGGEEPTATLAFHTVSGEAHVTEPFRKTDRRLWQVGAVNRGPRIDITTVSGDLVAGFVAAESAFTSAIPTPPAPPVPPDAPAQPSSPSPIEPDPATVGWPRDDVDVAVTAARPEAAPSTAEEDAVRDAVLAAVERGEIDVEEALRRLEAVDSMSSS